MKKNPSSKNLRFVFAAALFITIIFLFAIVGISYLLLYGPSQMHPPETARAMAGRTIGFAVFCLIIGFVCERVVNKMILKPIMTLNQGMKEVAGGNFDYRLNTKSDILEIREMTNSFNVMAVELGSTETLRSDFVNNVSHEFKTPLSAIEGYAVLLQNDQLDKTERMEYLQRMTQSTRRLTRLTENILKISRLENQDYKLERKRFNLAEQLRIAILFLETEWATKGIEWNIAIEEKHYFGNEDLLLQVWLNLLGNAIKFTPKNGQISVVLTSKDGFLKITISDSGIGMSDPTIKHIFDKFYQADLSHSGEGNGLGLPLAKRIIDIHNGGIFVKSTLGKGSSFEVTL